MAILKSRIVVVPIGEVDYIMVHKLAEEAGRTFNRSAEIFKGMKMPREAHNVIRNQYYVTVILAKMERIKANSREKILGVCEEDLYLPDEKNIIGHADMISGTAIVSLYEIRQEFYGLPEDDKKIYPRLFKEAVHQTGHLFNLSDCRNPRCVNYYSQMMLDIDNKGEKFCDICQRQLTSLV